MSCKTFVLSVTLTNEILGQDTNEKACENPSLDTWASEILNKYRNNWKNERGLGMNMKYLLFNKVPADKGVA